MPHNTGTNDELRPLLFSIAYRMLGTVGDAEDVVQEALLRLERSRREGIEAGDATFIGDGGGKGRGLPRPILGRDRVVRLLRGFFSEGAEIGARMQPTVVNGQPGVLNFDREDRLINVLVLEIADGVIETLRSIINPEKLGHLGYPLSAVARARQPRRD